MNEYSITATFTNTHMWHPQLIVVSVWDVTMENIKSMCRKTLGIIIQRILDNSLGQCMCKLGFSRMEQINEHYIRAQPMEYKSV